MVKLYVEGGGDAAALKSACREGFAAFITKAGIARRPRIVACGSRRDAFDSYCIAVANGEDAVLLVDSESPVNAQTEPDRPETWQPWEHLKARMGDGWHRPANVPDTDCHLMAQCTESWFLADRALKAFFGNGFKDNQLPAMENSVEQVAKTQVYKSLANATKDCKSKAQYGKGERSFKILALLSPANVVAASPWAKRFVDELRKKMGA
jgi:hypothetical protein